MFRELYPLFTIQNTFQMGSTIDVYFLAPSIKIILKIFIININKEKFRIDLLKEN